MARRKRKARRTAKQRAATRKLIALNRSRSKAGRTRRRRRVASRRLGGGPGVHPQGAAMLGLAGIAGLMGYGIAKTTKGA
jgi:hypothetical protein